MTLMIKNIGILVSLALFLADTLERAGNCKKKITLQSLARKVAGNSQSSTSCQLFVGLSTLIFLHVKGIQRLENIFP